MKTLLLLSLLSIAIIGQAQVFKRDTTSYSLFRKYNFYNSPSEKEWDLPGDSIISHNSFYLIKSNPINKPYTMTITSKNGIVCEIDAGNNLIVYDSLETIVRMAEYIRGFTPKYKSK